MKTPWIAFVTMGLLFSSGKADEAPSPVIPLAHSSDRYEAAWSRNPFLRETGAPKQIREDLSRHWKLAGMAEFDGKIRVTIANKHTGEKVQLTDQDPLSAEIRLLSAHFSRSLADASVEIQKGTEKATLKYSESR